MRRTAPLTILALVCALIISVGCAVTIGPAGIPLKTLLSSPNTWMIFWDVRLPRVFTAALVGCGLAVAGTTMQGLFRNPMADPYIIGTSSGGALGATIAIVLLAGNGRPVLAFLGRSRSLHRLLHRPGGERSGRDALSPALLFNASFALLLYDVYRRAEPHQIMFWLMGGFWNVSWNDFFISLPS